LALPIWSPEREWAHSKGDLPLSCFRCEGTTLDPTEIFRPASTINSSTDFRQLVRLRPGPSNPVKTGSRGNLENCEERTASLLIARPALRPGVNFTTGRSANVAGNFRSSCYQRYATQGVRGGSQSGRSMWKRFEIVDEPAFSDFHGQGRPDGRLHRRCLALWANAPKNDFDRSARTLRPKAAGPGHRARGNSVSRFRPRKSWKLEGRSTTTETRTLVPRIKKSHHQDHPQEDLNTGCAAFKSGPDGRLDRQRTAVECGGVKKMPGPGQEPALPILRQQPLHRLCPVLYCGFALFNKLKVWRQGPPPRPSTWTRSSRACLCGQGEPYAESQGQLRLHPRPQAPDRLLIRKQPKALLARKPASPPASRCPANNLPRRRRPKPSRNGLGRCPRPTRQVGHPSGKLHGREYGAVGSISGRPRPTTDPPE